MAVRVKLDDVYDVDDLALELGATVESPGGQKFNTAGLQTTRKPKPVAPAPVAEPSKVEAKETVQPEMMALLKQLIEVAKRPVEVTIPPIPAPQVTVKAAEQKTSPRAWTFEFERNSNGTIKKINATAKE